MPLKKMWWSERPEERFWMEVTDRSERLGDDLLAPQRNGTGGEECSYTLVSETKPGDIVFHWHKSLAGRPAIIGWSEVVGPLSVGTISWQARGTRGRARGGPTSGPSWQMECGGLNQLETPVTAADVNGRIDDIRRIFDKLTVDFGAPLYLPFSFYRPTELRAAQGYLMKFPAALVGEFTQLAPLLERTHEPELDFPANAGGHVRRTQDTKLRIAIERRAVDLAKAHYLAKGATHIKELGKPYDLVVHGLGPARHVEVKGSSSRADAVELTVNEVAHARNYPHTDLVVVDRIEWQIGSSGDYITSGGTIRVWSTWQPAEEDLGTTRFRYDLPDDRSAI